MTDFELSPFDVLRLRGMSVANHPTPSPQGAGEHLQAPLAPAPAPYFTREQWDRLAESSKFRRDIPESVIEENNRLRSELHNERMCVRIWAVVAMVFAGFLILEGYCK